MYKWFLGIILVVLLCLGAVGEYHFNETLEWQYNFAYELGYQDALNR